MRFPDAVRSRATSLTGLALLLVLASACGGEGSDGPDEVSASALEAQIAENYAPAAGTELDIDCAEALAPEVDATATCTVDDGESRSGVRFTTTAVDGDEVSYRSTPFLEGTTVAETLTTELEGQGYAVDSLECPENLEGVADATTECSVTSQGQDATIDVTVTEVDGLRIGFSFRTR